MGLFNYIFIFFFLSFGLIESKYRESSLKRGCLTWSDLDSVSAMEISLAMEKLRYGSGFFGATSIQLSDNKIIINEIMADPTPVAGLPDREYIELFNSGAAPVNLKNWILELGSKQKILTGVTVDPGGFLLITAPGGAKELQEFGKIVEISGFGVTNSGLVLTLFDPERQLADQVKYLPSMHTKGFEEGGYSLERIDPGRMCGQGNNWTTTLSAKGGTPGTANSVKASNPDQNSPMVVSISFEATARLEVQFTESLQLPVNLLEMVKNLSPGVSVDSIRMDQTRFLMSIWFHPATILNGANCSMVLHGVKDECGNLMADYPLKFGYYLPVKGDLLISEVLFNPYPDGSDFVEIYNNSAHEVDLSGLFLASRDEKRALRQVTQLSLNQQYLNIGSYLAVTKSKESIYRFYRTGGDQCLFQMMKFPILTDESGTVVLLNQFQEIIDEMSYHDGMHDPLIAETEGISLERISLDVPASRKENWYSAAKSAGFATPGYKNSVTASSDSIQPMFQIEPVIFSPNGDQVSDQLNICINAGEPGGILNITILNCTGRIVRHLANNQSTGSSDILVWDGLCNDNQKVESGIYILHISLFHRNGSRRTARIACVVTDHL